jgi:NAD-dependent dihydropyrimidine dehydrogenase PreA subunit
MAKKYTDPIYKEQLTLHRKEVGYTAKEYWVQRFGGVCHDCKQVYPSYVYDFHHINGDKEESPSHLIRNKGIDNAAVLEELNKCILLCANCHRIRHHGPTSETQESGKGGLKNESQ